MNWGFKIGIVFVSFVALMVSMVTICMRQKNIHLVTENYYEKEIAYQDQIDSETNTAALKAVPKIEYAKESGMLTVHYASMAPGDAPTGNILFFRPSDAKQDFSVPLKMDQLQQQKISVADLEKGLWKIKMEWAAVGKKYYLEERLVVL